MKSFCNLALATLISINAIPVYASPSVTAAVGTPLPGDFAVSSALSLSANCEKAAHHKYLEGQKLADEKKYSEACDVYKEGLAICEQSLSRDSQDEKVLAAKAFLASSLAWAKGKQGKFAEGISDYRDAINTCDDLIGIKPGAVAIKRTKACCLSGLGLLQSELSNHFQAAEYYRQAAEAYQLALVEVPNDPDMLFREGCAFSRLAGYQVLVGNVVDGRKDFSAAEECFAQALKVSPNFRDSHLNLAFALIGEGICEHGLKDNVAAIESYDRAVSELNKAASDKESGSWVPVTLALALEKRAKVLEELDRLSEARASYRQAEAVRKEIRHHRADRVAG